MNVSMFVLLLPNTSTFTKPISYSCHLDLDGAFYPVCRM